VGTKSLTVTKEGAVSEKSTRNEVDYATSPEWRGIAPFCVGCCSFGLQIHSRAVHFQPFRAGKRRFLLSFGGVFGLFGAYFAELFPEKIRAMGGGFAFNVGRGFGAVVTPFTIGLMAKTYGLGFGIGACSIVFFAGVVTLYFMPETLKLHSN
jgi:MFS family permease